jgi:flagellin
MECAKMALNVISNYAANVAQRYLQKADSEATRSVAKLAAGSRVLSARDDAASLAVGLSLKADVVSLKQAAVNVGQASSVIQIADGAMSTVTDILLRMKTLSVQAASDQLASTQRTMLNSEFTELLSEVDRVAAVTNFDGQSLTTGSLSASGLKFQVGHANTANDSIEVKIDGIDTTDLSVAAKVVSTYSDATTALAAINTAIDTIATSRAKLGASQNRLEFAGANIATQMENAEAARSTLMDLDVAAEMSSFTSNQILQQAGVSMLAQANQMPQNLLRLFR